MKARRCLIFLRILCGKCLSIYVSVAVLALVGDPRASAQSVKNWVPSGSAGWFVSGNWTPLGAPAGSNIARVSNGGTAQATAGTTNISVDRIEIGANDGAGGMTVGGSNRTITIASDFDIAATSPTSAVGAVNFTSDGTVTIDNATSLYVGVSAAGDIDLATTGTGADATATGIGMMTIEDTGVVEVFGDFDVAQTSAVANSTANANANLTVTN